ncbi:MAG: adenylyl-sulfate kinase [Betaproteobacteria bacterium]|nr:adenylyl-sulfate kinase [Betaproteobacteria bacterium]
METVKHLTWHVQDVSREMREARNGHGSFVLWLTGLSGAGKSTLAAAIDRRLFDLGCHSMVLDGDNVRQGLCADLGFSLDERRENIRRVGEVGKLLVDAGGIAIVALISPLRADRDRVRSRFAAGRFVEIWCDAPLQVCEQRDPKGLYKKARAGQLCDFTGVSSPYEPPLRAEIRLDTAARSVADDVDAVMEFLGERELVRFAEMAQR